MTSLPNIPLTPSALIPCPLFLLYGRFLFLIFGIYVTATIFCSVGFGCFLFCFSVICFTNSKAVFNSAIRPLPFLHLPYFKNAPLDLSSSCFISIVSWLTNPLFFLNFLLVVSWGLCIILRKFRLSAMTNNL